MIEILTAACGGFLAGWICRARQLPMGPPRCSYGRFSDEHMRGPRLMTVDEWALKYGSQLDPVRPRHPGSDNGGPTTPKPPIKPQPSGGRMIREDQWDPGWKYLNGPGYQPRPSNGGTPNPPPSEP